MHRLPLAAAALLLATTVSAQDAATPPPERQFRLFGTSDTLFESNHTAQTDPNLGDYRKFKEQFSLNLAWSSFTAGVQVEYLYYSDWDRVDPLDLDRMHKELGLRKYYLEYIKDRASFRLGTFFTSFGQGLTLYVQKNDQLGLDEPLHGGTGTVNLGPLELTALGGRVTDPLLESRYRRHFKDELWGGHARVHLPADLYVGASYAHADLDSISPSLGQDEAKVWSTEGGGYGIAGLLDAHAEWAEIDKLELGRAKSGYGRYLSLSSTLGPITLLGEVKDYWNFSYRYNNPPTLGPSEEEYDHDDVKGERLKVDANIAATGSLVWAGYGTFDTHRKAESLGGLGGDAQREWYLGLQETVRPVYLEASYFDRDYADRGLRENHLLADLHLATGSRGDVSLGFDGRNQTTDYYSLARNRSDLSFSWAPYGSVTLRYAWNDRTRTATEEFWGGEVQYLPRTWITLSLFVGSDPGGLVCSGGQCREEPKFKGARAQAEWRF